MTDDAGDRFDTQQHHRPPRARLARRRHPAARARRRRRRRALPRALARADRRAAAGHATARRRPATAPCRSCGRSPRTCTTPFPRGSFRIFESYLRLLRGAQELIYLENQFLWSPEIVDVLADKLRNPPTPDFRVVILLPAKANNGAEDTRGQLGVLIEADDGHGRVLGATIRSMAAEGGRADPAVRARQGRGRRRPLADRRLGQPQRPLVLQRHRDVRGHRRRGAGPRHPGAAVGRAPRAARRRGRASARRWRSSTRCGGRSPREQLRRQRAGEPPTHRLLELPGVSRRSRPPARAAVGSARRRLSAAPVAAPYDLAVRSAGTQQSRRGAPPTQPAGAGRPRPALGPRPCTAARALVAVCPRPQMLGRGYRC